MERFSPLSFQEWIELQVCFVFVFVFVLTLPLSSLLIASIPRRWLCQDLTFLLPLSNFSSRIHFRFLNSDHSVCTSVLDSPRATLYTQALSLEKGKLIQSPAGGKKKMSRFPLNAPPPKKKVEGEINLLEGISFWIPSSATFWRISVHKYLCRGTACWEFCSYSSTQKFRVRVHSVEVNIETSLERFGLRPVAFHHRWESAPALWPVSLSHLGGLNCSVH